MEDLGIIDQFTNTFSQYIDTGFGLLGGEVRYLTVTLIAIDITLAGLFWAIESRDVIPQLLRKILYVGAFAFILNNFNTLASVLVRSFAGLGLTATGSALTAANLFRPGQVAAVGVTAAQPLLTQMGDLAGFPDLFLNIDTVLVLFLAWLIIIISFFILSVQMFVTLIEFKLTTLAGFVLVPFALWNKTAFLAEKVLGNVISSGVKVLVLAVIVGIGMGLFGQFADLPAGNQLTIQNALAIVLASLALLGLGLFGPAIATGLVSGGPQLGAGSAAGAALFAGGLAVVGGAAALGAGRVALAAGQVAAGTRTGGGGGAPGDGSGDGDGEPAWARRMRQRQRIKDGMTTATHVARSTDRGGGGASPDLGDGK